MGMRGVAGRDAEDRRAGLAQMRVGGAAGIKCAEQIDIDYRFERRWSDMPITGAGKLPAAPHNRMSISPRLVASPLEGGLQGRVIADIQGAGTGIAARVKSPRPRLPASPACGRPA